MIEVLVKLHLSTGIIEFSKYGRGAIPHLDAINSISRVTSESLENCTVSVEIIDIKNIAEKLTLEKQKVLVEIFETDTVVFAGWIATWEKDYNKNTIKIKVDLFQKLDQDVSVFLTKVDFPNIPEENEGKVANIIYGDGSSKTFVAQKIDENLYIAAHNTLLSIFDIMKIDGSNLPDASFEIDTKGRTIINVISSDLELHFSAIGPGTDPVEQLKEIVSPSFSVMADNAQQYFIDRGYTGCVFVTERKKYRELFTDFAKTFHCYVQLSRNGVVELNCIRWGIDEPVTEISSSAIKDFSRKQSQKDIYKYYRRYYQYDPGTKEYKRQPNDYLSDAGMSGNTGEHYGRFINCNANSWDVLMRKVFLENRPKFTVTFEVPNRIAVNLDLFKIVTIRHRMTNFEPRDILLMREKRQYKGCRFVMFEGIDITDITIGIFALYEEGNPGNPYIDDNTGPFLI